MGVNPLTGKKAKKNLMESLTIRQANHKNYALDAHMKLVEKVISQEKFKRMADIDKERKRILGTINTVKEIFPLSGDNLKSLHESRKRNIADVAVHVVSCYMKRQESNRDTWRDLQLMKQMPPERPVTTPDHLLFIHTAFPETYTHSVENGFKYNYQRKADIYEHGRAGHDMKCMSTRCKPLGAATGAYPPQKAVNVRFWRPPHDDSDEVNNTPRLKYTHADGGKNLKPATSYVSVPSLGLVEVNKNGGVYVMEENNDNRTLNRRKLKTHLPPLKKESRSARR